MIHHISFRAFVSATEDPERVKKALGIFVPLDLVLSSSAKGFYGNEIVILEATLKRKEGMGFFRILKEQLPPPDIARLKREAEARTDEDCQFHLRLDKQAAYQGRVELTDSRDAIDVCAHVATYPARPEEAVRMVKELF
ncbi:MAG: hypothetical protein A4E45_00850 [Methanosaeta sp. PtaB.Bin039]|nr:MAG: hypothetical protein A4E45_00850 [Methanosaeta sp. PtaB.Bin039]OPY44693.1 MAG: hypothetical protein A4E47_01384 [Methanosaeta sp. PtaU1.Bin028]HOT06764.1 RNA-binding domain-containing protein [Methanotrichaceae archaeon]HQF15961.1 RNA-binding domain-containing protein [Methanotrichaceae archaeon]HQI90691.1 RNA-binding domain-containing protein [Methanotrichaceae archaeon]